MAEDNVGPRTSTASTRPTSLMASIRFPFSSPDFGVIFACICPIRSIRCSNGIELPVPGQHRPHGKGCAAEVLDHKRINFTGTCGPNAKPPKIQIRVARHRRLISSQMLQMPVNSMGTVNDFARSNRCSTALGMEGVRHKLYTAFITDMSLTPAHVE